MPTTWVYGHAKTALPLVTAASAIWSHGHRRVGAVTGRTQAGEDDDARQILEFWIFLLCRAVLLVLGIVALVR